MIQIQTPPAVELLSSDRFHHQDKGCRFSNASHKRCDTYQFSHKECRDCYPLTSYKCIVHGVKICRCGYEWGYHFDEPLDLTGI